MRVEIKGTRGRGVKGSSEVLFKNSRVRGVKGLRVQVKIIEKTEG